MAKTARLEAQVKTQLIAHDKEVYDIAFSRGLNGRDQFASVGADGSVRMFDLRSLEHSTIIYESATISRGIDQPRIPLVRLAWNKQDPNYLATMPLDSTGTYKEIPKQKFCFYFFPLNFN